MLLANTLVYKNRLKCGTEEVAQSCLEIPHEDLLPSPLISGASDWIREVLLPSRRVVFLDTDQLPAVRRKKRGDHHEPNRIKINASGNWRDGSMWNSCQKDWSHCTLSSTTPINATLGSFVSWFGNFHC